MRKLRAVTAGALALTIVGAGAAVGGASAATATGVGTAKTSTSVLEVQLGGGKLLGLRLVGEDSQSTTDKKTGATSAFTRIVPLTLSSQAVQALNTSLAAVEARAPGGSNNVPAVSVPLSTPASSGTLNLASLTAAVDASGAKSALSSSLDDLALVGGLVTAPKVASTLGTEAVATNADGVRGVKADQITVLDLGALLDGLGLKLTDLPISVVSNLLSTLKLTVAGLETGTLQGAVDTLNGAIGQVNTLLTQIQANGGTLPSNVTNTVGGIVNTVDTVLSPVTTLQGRRLQAITIPTIPSVITTVGQVTQILDTLNQNLVDLLGNALGALDAAPLLQLKGIDVGLTTKAADTVANSVATVTAKIGDVVVGGNVVPGVDLAATATQVANLVNTVTGQIASALGTVDPGLATLVSVKLFDQSKSVTAANGYTTAVAKLSALTATITPPADLGAIVSKVQGLTGIGDVLGTLGVRLPAALPVLSDSMAQLEGALGGTVQALSQGATLSVASLSSTSEFAPAPAPTTVTAPGAPAGSATGELPRTGGDNARYAVLGVLFLALAAAIVRWLRRPVNAL